MNNTPSPFGGQQEQIQNPNFQNPFGAGQQEQLNTTNNMQQNPPANQQMPVNNTPNPFENNQANNNMQTQQVSSPQIQQQNPVVTQQTPVNNTPNPFENNPSIQSNPNDPLNLGDDLKKTASKLEMPSDLKENENIETNSTSNDLANLNSSMPDSSQSKEEIQEMIDETVEKVIEEKWEKLLKSVEKVVNWKERQEKEVELLKNTMSEVKDSFGKLEKKITNKISSYDSGLLDVNSEIKALEKVFQKITPTLVNNVNNLEKIAESIKKSTGVKIEKETSKK